MAAIGIITAKINPPRKIGVWGSITQQPNKTKGQESKSDFPSQGLC